jgi:hypothetical protein
MHFVKWVKVCCPIDEGGLGIRNVRRFNWADCWVGFEAQRVTE